ncbi:MAG: LysE family transporter [Tannerellaceae bacterium]|jgi:threonine/homoserine/homoserine lactone efflux protein|nr:LysE family transporter [Tannerellaceae bacterium]
MLSIIVKGLMIGFLVSAPLGPVGMLCIQRTLGKGRLSGFATGLGATLSDVIYASVACLGMGFVTGFIESGETPIRIAAAIALGLFGYYLWRHDPTAGRRPAAAMPPKKVSCAYDALTGFLLAAGNPTIVIPFMAIFARFGFVRHEYHIATQLAGLASIGIGALLWWFTATYFTSKLRQHITTPTIQKINRLTAAALILISITALLSTLIPSLPSTAMTTATTPTIGHGHARPY